MSARVLTTEISPGQCRAARALLDWTQIVLSKKAGIGHSTIADFERGARNPTPNNVRAMRTAFEEEGLVFIDQGVVFAFGETAPSPRLPEWRPSVSLDEEEEGIR